MSGHYYHRYFLDYWKCTLNPQISFPQSRQLNRKLSKTMFSFPLFIIGIGSSWLNKKWKLKWWSSRHSWVLNYLRLDRNDKCRGIMLRKQSAGVFCEKSCSEKFRNIPLETLVLESLLNKAAGLQASRFIKKRLQQRHFHMNITKFLRTPILKNICERLLLMLVVKNNLILTILINFPSGSWLLLSRTELPKEKMI